MGRSRVSAPRKLRSKLRKVRMNLLNLTMDELAEKLKRLGAEKTTHSGYIAEYESGKRKPSLLTLLAYSKATGLSINVFADDELDLP